DSLSRAPNVSHRPTHTLWFASVWAIKTRRSIGSKKVIANTTAITSPQFGSIRRLLHFMATRVSKRSPRKLFRRHYSRELLPRNERQRFRRAEAAHRLCGGGGGPHTARDGALRVWFRYCSMCNSVLSRGMTTITCKITE